MRFIIKFLKAEDGATAIEYSLIAAGIALAVIAVVNRLGTAIHNSFSTDLDEFELVRAAFARPAYASSGRWMSLKVGTSIESHLDMICPQTTHFATLLSALVTRE